MIELLKQANDLTKDQLKEEGINAARDRMADGYDDAAPLIIQARKAIEFLTAYSRELESKATDEIMLQDNNEVTALGCTISLGSTGDRLNFKLDPVWSGLTAQRSAREAMLKLARKDPGSVKDSDGVNVPTLPLASAAKSIVRVKL
jgi:hypothetical protein